MHLAVPPLKHCLIPGKVSVELMIEPCPSHLVPVRLQRCPRGGLRGLAACTGAAPALAVGVRPSRCSTVAVVVVSAADGW